MHAQDKVGINVGLLDQVQVRLLSLYGPPEGTPRDPLTVPPGAIFQEGVTATLYKATMQLLDDLHNNCRMLGVPERCNSQIGCRKRQVLCCVSVLRTPLMCRAPG